MKKFFHAFGVIVIIVQAHLSYACDEMSAENLGCRELSVSPLPPKNFEEKLRVWCEYSGKRQQEMRDEANDLRPSFEAPQNTLLQEISCLELDQRGIMPRYTRISYAIRSRKIDHYFESFSKNGEVFEFYDLLSSLVLTGVVMSKMVTQEHDAIDANISARKAQIQSLDHYALFYSESPTCQLRTKFIVMNEILNMLVTRVSACFLKEVDLKNALEKGEDLFLDFSACHEKLKNKGQEMSHACEQSDWERVPMLTNEIAHLAKELENIKKQQDELASEVSLLKTELQTIEEQKIQTQECLRLNVAELKECAEFANHHLKALERNKLRYNTLTVQDQIFLTEMLGFLRENYS